MSPAAALADAAFRLPCGIAASSIATITLTRTTGTPGGAGCGGGKD